MANYYREINKIMEKLIYKFSILDKNGLSLGGKGGNLSFLEVHIIKEIGKSSVQSIYSLIKETEIDRNTITTITNRLVMSGYLEKQRSEEDKRVYMLTLTDSGREIYKRIILKEKEVLDFVLNDITLNEEKAVLKFLSKINQKMV